MAVVFDPCKFGLKRDLDILLRGITNPQINDLENISRPTLISLLDSYCPGSADLQEILMSINVD